MTGSRIGTTLTQHVLEQQRQQASRTDQAVRGEFGALLTQIAVAGKIISAEVNMAGLADVLGLAGRTNVQGEEVMKLDEFSNNTLIE